MDRSAPAADADQRLDDRGERAADAFADDAGDGNRR